MIEQFKCVNTSHRVHDFGVCTKTGFGAVAIIRMECKRQIYY